MNIFTSGTFTWWQMGLLKLCVLSFGIAIGSTFASFFIPYVPVLLVLAAVLGVYLAYAWFK